VILLKSINFLNFEVYPLNNSFLTDSLNFTSVFKKNKIKLSISEEAEWLQYFNEQKAKATELQNQINQTDTEIDQMVYQLYGLTDEEIKIVEESF